MATDQESAPDAADLTTLRRSVVEHEFPTYQAVSTRAVFAVLCGLLASLSFAHPAFYLFAAAAVVLGWSADRAIRRHPDVLTGGRLARAGVGMGLVFGLSIFTVTTVQDFLTKRRASAFAVEYAQMLKTRPIADLYWIGLFPESRAVTTPEDNLKQMEDGQEQAAMAEMRYAGLRQLSADLKASEKNSITFEGIETMGKEDLTVVAIARFDVHVAELPAEPKEEKHEEGEEHKEGEEHEHAHPEGGDRRAVPLDAHAMAVIKGVVPEGKRGYEWWIEDVTYPYQPKTAALPEKAVDDGHGHAH